MTLPVTHWHIRDIKVNVKGLSQNLPTARGGALLGAGAAAPPNCDNSDVFLIEARPATRKGRLGQSRRLRAGRGGLQLTAVDRRGWTGRLGP